MASHDERFARPSRRQFLGTLGAGAATMLAAPSRAHHHPQPSPQSLPYLDTRTYIHNMEVIAHIPGRRGGGMQMMVQGDRRLIVQGRDVFDVTDPRNPKIINKGNAAGGQLGYNAKLKKWLCMQSQEFESGARASGGGKYDNPAAALKTFRGDKRLRGIRMWDATNPEKFVQISEFSTGQTGTGTHGDGCYYDGGKYAYLAGAPDDTFTHSLSPTRLPSDCLMIVDVSDPAAVKHVANWWVPGQRANEVEEFKKWNTVRGHGAEALESTKTVEDAVKSLKNLKYPALDRRPYSIFHGPMYVPKRVEDGGTRGYGAWAAFGFLIHDVSQIAKPRLVGRFDPTPSYGMDGIAFHNIYLGMIDRGFVVTNPEPMNPDCNESFLPLWVVDVRDEANPVPIAMLPRPVPPKEAPYTDFCFARGRFGAHVCPPPQAPGKPSPTFYCCSFFNAGVRCYDLSEPSRPQDVAYFIPPNGGTLSPECREPHGLEGEALLACNEEGNSYNRPVDNVFVEFDRNIIYACTTTGVYVLTCPALGKPVYEPMPVTQWGHPGVNVGLTSA